MLEVLVGAAGVVVEGSGVITTETSAPEDVAGR